MEISRRSSVALREIWPLETDFSDWLVSEEGIAMIAEDIGIYIEDAQRECRSGDLPCDIVARVQGEEEHTVVIENQFGKTNHDHLGKLLTYASVNNATTAIWISETISDDHRKAIDWLNEITPVHVNFYLSQIQAYRIGNSAVAPQLVVVCRPNIEVKVQREKIDFASNQVHSWTRDFWDDVLSYIKSQKPPFKVRNAGFDSWTGISVGRSGFLLALSVPEKRSRICCELDIDASWRFSAFEQLLAQKAEIENEIGCELEWLELRHKRISRIKLHADIDPSDEAKRDEVKLWMAKYSAAFYQAFRTRIQNLSPGQANSSDNAFEEDES